MQSAITIVRPLPLRLAAAATLLIIGGWAAVNGDLSSFGVIAYPAIVALQAYREWTWRLEVSRNELLERPGVGPARTIPWRDIEAVVMPDAAWWRINPILRVSNGPNIQMTAAEDLEVVLELAAKRRTAVEGSAASISLPRSLLPWVILLALASLLLGSELAGLAT